MIDTSERLAANAAIITEFRANGGHVTGPFADVPLLLLTTHGAKSGALRTSPVAYTVDGERFIIMASNGGRPIHPAWYHNLQVAPEATIEVGCHTVRVVASEATEPERTRLYEQQIAAIPLFAGFQPRATRLLPVVMLHRVD